MNAPAAADLVDQYWALAMSIARNFSRSLPFLQDELISEASFALWQAATSFRPGPRSFAFWATVRIKWNLLRVLATWKLQRRVGVQWLPTGAEDIRDPVRDKVDPSPSPEERIDVEDLVAFCRQHVPARHLSFMEARANGRRVQDLAEENGISRSRVTQLCRHGAEYAREANPDLVAEEKPSPSPSQDPPQPAAEHLDQADQANTTEGG